MKFAAWRSSTEGEAPAVGLGAGLGVKCLALDRGNYFGWRPLSRMTTGLA